MRDRTNVPSPRFISLGRAVLLAAISVGCSASALSIQARTADTIARSVNAASTPVIAVYREAQLRVVGELCPSAEHCDGPAVRSAVAAIRARWALVWASHDSLRVILDTWSVQIETCARAQGAACTPDVLAMAGRVLAIATTWRCALRAVGVADPIPLPVTCAGADGGAP